MKENKKYIYSYTLIVFILYIIYYFSDQKKNRKFLALFSIISGVGVLLGAYSVYDNHITSLEKLALDRSTQYTELTKDLIVDTNNLIMDDQRNIGLKYYYASLNDLKELITEKDIKERDLMKEFAYTSTIFNKISHIVIYIKYISETEDDFVINNLKYQVSKILEIYMKSPDFVENWKKYKEIYANENLINFMKINFGV